MAVPTFAAGAGVAAATTSVAVGYPAGGILANDKLAIVALVHPDTATIGTPAGWTLHPLFPVTSGPAGGLNSIRAYLFTKDAAGGESGTVTLTRSAGTEGIFGRMYRYRGDAALTFEHASVQAGTTAAIPSPALGPTTAADRLAVLFAFVGDDNAIGPWAELGPPDWLDSVLEFVSTTGNDACLSVGQQDAAASGTTIVANRDTMSAADPWVIFTATLGVVSSSTPKSAAETGTGTDASSKPDATTSAAETAAGADASSKPDVALSSSDGGTGSDAGALTVPKSAAETAAGTDASSSLDRATSTSETGAGSDAGALEAARSSADTAAAADASSAPAASIDDDDAGAGADTVANLNQGGQPIEGSDTGVGTDSSSPPSVVLAAIDLGAGGDVAGLLASSSSSDTATASEAVALAVTIAGAEAGQGLEVAVLELRAAELGIADDVAAIAAAHLAGDLGDAIEAAAIAAVLEADDLGVLELELSRLDLVASDVGLGIDLATLQTAAELGTAGDPVRLGTVGRAASGAIGRILRGRTGRPQ